MAGRPGYESRKPVPPYFSPDSARAVAHWRAVGQAIDTSSFHDGHVATVPGDARGVTAPDAALRVVGAMLALGVAAVHVADQGGVTALGSLGAWMGWGFRLIEAGGAATALVLLVSPLAPPALA